MANIISNGSIFCLSSASTPIEGVIDLRIPAFNNGAITVTNVVVTVTLPPGLAFSTDSPTQGTFDDLTGEWTVGSLTTAQDEDNAEYLDLCLEVTDDTEAPFEITWVLTCTECPDQNTANDTGSRTIEGFSCSEFGECFEAFMTSLQEFDSMEDAVTALGFGKPFLYSEANIDGATYRGLHVTPLT